MILCAASAPNHVSMIAAPLTQIRSQTRILLGGPRRLWGSLPRDLPATHVRDYAYPPRRFWSRQAWLEGACRNALDVHDPQAVIITSARYHLEQALLRVCKGRVSVIAYLSTYFTERFQPEGPRMQFYDVADAIAVMGPHLRDELVRYGVQPERIHVLGAPWLEAM